MPGGDGTGPVGGVRGSGRMQEQPVAGFGRGRMRGPFAAGPGGECVCPSCGHSEPHLRGVPCNSKVCPQCNTRMTRAR